MQEANYLLYLKQTALSANKKTKRHLIQLFIDKGIAYKGEQIPLTGEQSIDISNLEIEEQYNKCIESSEQARHCFERWEFEQDYKYSVVFKCNELTSLIEQTEKLPIAKDTCYENEYIFERFTDFTNPIVYDTDAYRFLKFNLAFSAMHPNTEEELLLKYPFLVVIHKKDNIIEFRFDIIKKFYLLGRNYENTIYANLIDSMISYLKNKFKVELIPLPLDFMIEESKKDNSEVKLIAQYMKLPKGGNAELNVGNNQEYVLPFIGELKNLLFENKAELEKVPVLNEALEQFMYEMEEMSDYPWIELLWENEIKTRSIHVKFIFNYMNREYCLMQHYYSNTLIGMERMNYVIQYIVEHKKNNSRTNEK